MALPRVGFNEGSLLRRTLLHVGTFVLGSVAFISLVSFMLVSIARGLVSPHAAAVDEDATAAAASVSRPLSAPLAKPGVTHGTSRRGGPNVPAIAPVKDD